MSSDAINHGIILVSRYTVQSLACPRGSSQGPHVRVSQYTLVIDLVISPDHPKHRQSGSLLYSTMSEYPGKSMSL